MRELFCLRANAQGLAALPSCWGEGRGRGWGPGLPSPIVAEDGIAPAPTAWWEPCGMARRRRRRLGECSLHSGF